jgi:vanillate O-demethylase ferredoxin subunit
MAATNNEVWQKGTIESIEEIAQGIKKFIIRQTSSAIAAPGSHIDLMVEVNGGLVRRSYSVVSQSPDLSTFTIAVFQVKNSRGGSIAMHQLQIGDSLDITQPIQNFPLRFGAQKYVLLAGGIGVTAIIAMANALKTFGADYEFHYVGRSWEAMAFTSELKQSHGDKMKFYVDDKGTPLNIGAFVSEVNHNDEVYMCGPIRLMDEVRRTWSISDLDITKLRYETFGVSGWFDPEEFIVRLLEKNAEVRVSKDQTIVEALEAAGLEVMADCRKGECGLCEARIISYSGKLDHRDVFYSEEQKSEGLKIACCVSRLVGEGTTAAIDVILT